MSIRSEKIEGLFINYLNRYRPIAGQMALLQATLRMVWEEKRGKSGEQSAHLKAELDGLKEQIRLLDEAFLYKKVIKEEKYRSETVRLEVEVQKAQKNLADSELKKLDIDGALAYLEEVATKPGKLWMDYSLNQKQRFQKLLFPKGIQFLDGEYGTAETPLFIELLSTSAVEKKKLVAPRGIEPRLKD